MEKMLKEGLSEEVNEVKEKNHVMSGGKTTRQQWGWHGLSRTNGLGLQEIS